MLTGTALDIPGLRKKEPDQSARPWNYPDPYLGQNHLVPLIPATGKPFPTIVVEIGVSESIASIRSQRQLYLNHLTGVNVYIGVSYNKNQTRATDTWHCCIARRDTNPGNPP